MENAQPLVINYVKGTLAIAHNGNLVNAVELREELSKTGAIFQTTIDVVPNMSFQEAIQYRTELHKLAELSGQEIKTAQYIQNKLEEMGFNVRSGVGGHGLVVDIDSGNYFRFKNSMSCYVMGLYIFLGKEMKKRLIYQSLFSCPKVFRNSRKTS